MFLIDWWSESDRDSDNVSVPNLAVSDDNLDDSNLEEELEDHFSPSPNVDDDDGVPLVGS